MSQLYVKDLLRKWAPVMVLLMLCIIISAINPSFLSMRNFSRIMTATAAPLMVALGITFIIIMGSIDLSIEGVLAFSGALLAMMMIHWGGFTGLGYLAIPATLLLSAGLGLLTGIIHIKLKIPSFLVSLGVGFSLVGATMVITGGERIPLADPVFRLLLTERYLDFPLMVYLAWIGFFTAWFIQEYTALGRNFYAVGGGEHLAYASGLHVNRIRVLGFALAGAFYGLGAIFAVARLGSVASNLGDGYAFVAITSVVVGGTSLMGGNGGVWQTLIGVLIINVINNGMVLVGFPTYIQQGVLGALVIVAVALVTQRKRLQIVK